MLYDWLLRTTPPDGTVLQNLESGQTTESQIVYIVAGQQFFAASNNNYATFVTKAYQRLLDRNPTQWELDSAVEDLTGYWVYECDPGCQQKSCCYRVEYRKTRSAFTWEILRSHEFHQVAAGYMCGLILRRVPTATEIEDEAYYIGSYGLKEGAVRLLKGEEYFSKSTQPW